MKIYVVTWSGWDGDNLQTVWSTLEAAKVQADRLGVAFGEGAEVFECDVDSTCRGVSVYSATKETSRA